MNTARKLPSKLIRHGLDIESIVRRFRRERQILANLDHPNIARLLDGGTTEDGWPYLVMEHIAGQPITAYCNQRRLGVADRLRLFQTVCETVHYAHQRLVIHLDIKPANILVTASGAPKLLDFGIARLLDPTAAPGDTTVWRPFTPDYSSPEQIRGETATVASDIYSLGVLLYELVSGERPCRLSGLAPHAAAQLAAEVDPQPPSAAAANRKVQQQLSGDLDNIVLMALRKDPQRRYASAAQLSEDVGRRLAGLPVLATRDTLFYRCAKFVRRHKAGVLAAALCLAALMAGSISTAWQAQLARAQRSKAQAEQAIAERRLDEFLKLTHSLLFDYHDAIAGLSGSTPIRMKLVRDTIDYLDRLGRESGGSLPLQRQLAAAYLRIGDVQGRPYSANLGDTAGALASYRRAAALLQPLSAAHPRDDGLRSELGDAREAAGRLLTRAVDYPGALENLRQALAIRLQLAGAHPENAGYRRELAASWLALGDPLLYQYQFTAAMGAYAESGEILGALRAANPADLQVHREWCMSQQRLGALYTSIAQILAQDLGDAADAAQASRKALHYDRGAVEVAERLVQGDPQRADFRRTLADVSTDTARTLRDLGDIPEALQLQGKSVAIFTGLSQADPANREARFDLLLAQHELARILAKSGSAGVALRRYQEGAAAGLALARQDPDNLEVRNYIADNYGAASELEYSTGDLPAALRQLTALLEVDERSASSPTATPARMLSVAADMAAISRVLAKSNRRAEARATAIRSLAIAQRIAGSREATPADWTIYAGMLMECPEKDLRDSRTALAYLQRALEKSPSAIATLRALAAAYYLNGASGKAFETAARLAALLPYPPQARDPATLHRDIQALAAAYRK